MSKSARAHLRQNHNQIHKSRGGYVFPSPVSGSFQSDFRARPSTMRQLCRKHSARQEKLRQPIRQPCGWQKTCYGRRSRSGGGCKASQLCCTWCYQCAKAAPRNAAGTGGCEAPPLSSTASIRIVCCCGLRQPVAGIDDAGRQPRASRSPPHAPVTRLDAGLDCCVRAGGADGFHGNIRSRIQGGA